MMTQPTDLGAITERRIERVLTREGCMELALHQIIMKCDGSEMQTKRIRNIRERAKAGLDGRDPSSPGELGHVPPNHLLMAQLELSGKETDAARAERDALAAEQKQFVSDFREILNAIKAESQELKKLAQIAVQVNRACTELPDGWDITIFLEKEGSRVDLYFEGEEVDLPEDVELPYDCDSLANYLEAAIDHAIATAGVSE